MSDASAARRHKGSGHFLAQRLTALALIPLAPWFVAGVAVAARGGHAGVLDFFALPINAGGALVFLAAACFHMQLGVQVVIEDYLSKPATRTALLALNALVALAAFATGGWAIWRMCFGA
ncbi:MAG: succinate dehydrogenase, hydrophobic membrane anchor protein [Hyphomonadaceae bacterium]